MCLNCRSDQLRRSANLLLGLLVKLCVSFLPGLTNHVLVGYPTEASESDADSQVLLDFSLQESSHLRLI